MLHQGSCEPFPSCDVSRRNLRLNDSLKRQKWFRQHGNARRRIPCFSQFHRDLPWPSMCKALLFCWALCVLQRDRWSCRPYSGLGSTHTARSCRGCLGTSWRGSEPGRSPLSILGLVPPHFRRKSSSLGLLPSIWWLLVGQSQLYRAFLAWRSLGILVRCRDNLWAHFPQY